MTRIYRTALIGCGDIARTGHLPALMEHDRFELAVACDVRPERATLLAQRAGGAEPCEDFRQLLGGDDIDAVILAVHPQDSLDIAVEFLQQGKPVLDEKPMAVDVEHGRHLAKVVEQTRAVYQIGFVFRYCDMVRRIGEMAQLIGTPALYQVGIFDERIDRADTAHFQRMQQILTHSSAINHEGSHVFDYARLWNGSPFVQAAAAAVRTEADLAGPNLWLAQLTMQDGSALQLTIGWLIRHIPASTVSITGSKGSLFVDLFAGTGRFDNDGRSERLTIAPLQQAWQRQLDTFAASIDRGEAVEATVHDGLAALIAAQACQQAQAENSLVNVSALALG